MKINFKKILKHVFFYGIVIMALLMSSSQDPETNWIIKLVGFVAIVYSVAKILYPENFKK